MRRNFLTIQEAVAYMETLDSKELSDDDEIVCFPPEPGIVTDEEDINENDFADTQPFDTSGTVEVFTKRKRKKCVKKLKNHPEKKRKLKEMKMSNETQKNDISVMSSKQQKRSISEVSNMNKRRKIMDKTSNGIEHEGSTNKKIIEKSTQYDWNKIGEILPIENEKMLSLEESHPQLFSLSPYELFRKYIDDDILQFMVDETIRYARQKNDVTFNLTVKDMEKFLGIILFTGYHHLPQEDMYWSRADDCNTPLVHETMPRQRFRDIKKYLHLCNNDSLDTQDKLGKVRRFIEMFCQKLQQFGIFSENLSVDEEMIPYTGKHSAKMYMRGKPIKFGFKLWVLASSDGYPFNLKVYVGKENMPNNREHLPLGTRVVLDLIPCISNAKCHTIYVDNFFNSITLLQTMRDKEFRITGTMRENRLQKCPLKESKEIKKQNRGALDKISTKEFSVVKWNDNRVVCMASNFENVEALGKTKRWCHIKKKKIEIDQPSMIANYNANMGGVDSLDRYLSQYRPKIRGKKWWWPFFANTVNMAVIAAWRIKRKTEENLSQLDFLRSVTTSLIRKEEATPSRQTGHLPKQNNDVRFDGVNHFIESGYKQSRCKVCNKNTRLWCIKCKINLHKDCSYLYHTK